MIQEIFTMENLEFILRMVLAVIYGALIGRERSSTGHPAGSRTHALVCVASCMAVITGMALTKQYPDSDVARIPAQVVTGVGFLGAGMILITNNNKVKGLTTAAGIWACACLGLTVGAGLYLISVVGCVMMVVIMRLGKIKKQDDDDDTAGKNQA